MGEKLMDSVPLFHSKTNIFINNVPLIRIARKEACPYLFIGIPPHYSVNPVNHPLGLCIIRFYIYILCVQPLLMLLSHNSNRFAFPYKSQKRR